MKKLIAFDGEEELMLDPTDLENLSPTELVGLFESTAVYRDLIFDLFKDPLGLGFGPVSSINGRAPNPEMVARVDMGFKEIYLRMNEVFGEDSTATIWSKISHAMLMEKCGEAPL